MKRPTERLAFAALPLLLGALSFGARAEDIDLYSAIQSNQPNPNLLIILDNSSAWNASQTFTCPVNNAAGDTFTTPANNVGVNAGVEQCGLHNAIWSIKSSSSLKGNINLGLMYFPVTDNSSTHKFPYANGGQFVLPSYSPTPSSLLTMDDTGITAMLGKIDGLDRQTDNSNNNSIAQAMQESWAFYQGYNYTTPKQAGLSSIRYPGVLGAGACGKNYVLYITLATLNQKPQDQGNLGGSSLQTAKILSSLPTQLALPTWKSPISGAAASSKYQADYSDEWSQFLYSGATTDPSITYPSIITYTIILSDGTNPDYEQLMVNMANQGGGKYFIVKNGDVSGLEQALLKVFNEVQAVNSVFASPGLPVSSNAQGTYLNQIFIATFRPDPFDNPRWPGNLKQYQFGVDTTNPTAPKLYLADASWGPYPGNTTGNSALSSSGTGFISPNAISFWTTFNTSTGQLPDTIGSTGGYWLNHPQGVGQGWDFVDGEFAEKGGVSQQIRLANLTDDYVANPTGPRKVYTCTTGGFANCAANSALSATPFATTNTDITATALGATGNPVGITQIARSDSTGGLVTVTLASTPSPALSGGQTVTIAGSQYSEFNGQVTVNTASGSSFTYTPVSVDPPTPATGSYTASSTNSPKSVTSLTRSGTTATATVPAHGFASGQQITVSGATGAAFNGTYAITVVDANTFTYTVAEGPTTPASGGTATVNVTSIPIATVSRFTTGASYKNGGNTITPPNSGTAIVTVTSSSPMTFTVGTQVTIAGVSDSGYNIAKTLIVGRGTDCPSGSQVKSGSTTTYYSLCYFLATTPATPDPSTTITAGPPAATYAITQLSRAASTCPTSSQVLVTAQTGTTAPILVAGQKLTIGGTLGANEAAYTGTVTVQDPLITYLTLPKTTYAFTYKINVSPGCSDTTSGMTMSPSGAARDALIRWVRGQDNVGDEPSPGGGITTRPYIHGDVLHSRPTVINYGKSVGPDGKLIGVVVYYGGNDGVFRAINGNQPNNPGPTAPSGLLLSPTAGAGAYNPLGYCVLTGNDTCAINGTPPGGELWGFVAPEFFTKLQRLYLNSPVVKLATTPTDIVPAPQPKGYFFDGPTSVYQTFNSDGTTSKAIIFLSARRGGQLIYALDVTDPTNPKFLWKHSASDTGFGQLGYTWSQPKVAQIHGNANPVLIFGGGYDTNEDNEPPTTDTMGNAIFIVDAFDGTLLWHAGPGGTSNVCSGNPCSLSGMSYAVAADITLLDRDFDGFIDRLYAADTGGNIWRVDLQPTAPTCSAASACGPSTWQVTKFASLGGTSSNGPRKFLFPPDVVPTKTFDAVLIGSGDREHPLLTQKATKVVNRFYMIKDTNVGMSATDATGLQTQATVVDNSAADSANAPSPVTLFNASTTPYNQTLSGYYILLNQNLQKNSTSDYSGEKVVNAPTTVGGFTFFGTNQPTAPSDAACTPNLGTARGYKINFLTASGGFTEFSGGGLPPSPVYGIVNVTTSSGQDIQLPFLLGGGGGALDGTVGGGQLETCSGPDCRSPLGGQKPPIPVPPQKKRLYWYRSVDR